MASNLPPLPPTKQLTPSIWRVLGGNPGKFTLQGSNTHIVGTGSHRLLIDTAQGLPAWKTNLQNTLSQISSAVTITDCILTHWHFDHVLGIKDLLELFPHCRLHKFGGASIDPDGNLQGYKIHDIHDGQIFDVHDGLSLKAIHTPGHTTDHIVLQITKSPDPAEVGRLFTADNVLGHGTAVFENLAQYTTSLKKMLTLIDAADTVVLYPAHGEVIDDGAAKISEYISHRAEREKEALNVLTYGSTRPGQEDGRDWSSMEMVKVIYAKYPSELHGPAEGSLLHVLEKLRAEGRVEKTESGKWRVAGERNGRL